MQHAGYADKSPAPADHKGKKPTVDRGVAADKKYSTVPKSRQRIEAAMSTLVTNNTLEQLVRDLKAENQRLREENDQVRGIANAFKKELEDFRAVFHDYCYSCVMADAPDDAPPSQKMDEN